MAGRSSASGRRNNHRSGPPSASVNTARKAPARSRFPRIRFPGRRAAAADGITSRRPTRPHLREAVLHPSQLGLPARRQPINPPRIAGQLRIPPSPLIERRIAHDSVASSPSNPSSRNESPATITLSGNSASRIRTDAIRALTSLTSCPKHPQPHQQPAAAPPTRKPDQAQPRDSRHQPSHQLRRPAAASPSTAANAPQDTDHTTTQKPPDSPNSAAKLPHRPAPQRAPAHRPASHPSTRAAPPPPKPPHAPAADHHHWRATAATPGQPARPGTTSHCAATSPRPPSARTTDSTPCRRPAAGSLHTGDASCSPRPGPRPPAARSRPR